jgi:undecaprenyl-diphosphatase
MLSTLFGIDVWLFHAVNSGLANPVLDAVMPVITNSRYWLPIYIIGIAALVGTGLRRRTTPEGRQLLWCAAMLIVVAVVFDKASNLLLKEVIQRPRPYLDLEGVRQLVGSGGGSFPSNHALNNAAAAAIIGSLYPRWAWLAASVALVIGFSRVYVGVHYPSDVLGGLAIGALAGLGLVRIARRWLH